MNTQKLLSLGEMLEKIFALEKAEPNGLLPLSAVVRMRLAEFAIDSAPVRNAYAQVERAVYKKYGELTPDGKQLKIEDSNKVALATAELRAALVRETKVSFVPFAPEDFAQCNFSLQFITDMLIAGFIQRPAAEAPAAEKKKKKVAP